MANEAAQAGEVRDPDEHAGAGSVGDPLACSRTRRRARRRQQGRPGHWWESQGKKLEGRAVAVEARKVADRVIAIVQPVEPVRQKAKRPEPKSLFAE